jgi:zinc protease
VEEGRLVALSRALGDVAQAQVAFGWRTVPSNHPDTVPLDLAAMLLGAGRSSRLYRAVREQRFASDVSAYNYTPTDLGVFVVQLEGDAAMSAPAAQAAWNQVISLGEDAAPAEVARAQRLFDARWLRRLESMDGQANYLADWEAQGGWELGDEYAERTRALTPADVTEAVQRHLDPQHAAALVYRPARAPSFAADTEAAFKLLTGTTHVPLSPVEVSDAVSPDGAARALRRRRVEANVHVYYTRQRVPILVRQRPGTPIVHLGLLSLGGSAREPLLLGGLSTLMTRAAVKGTTRRNAESIAFESESLGGSISGSVSSDGLGWAFSVPTHNFAAAVDLLADVVIHPALSQETLDTERRIALSQLAQLRDDMSRYPARLATEAAYRSHPYARSPLGSEIGLRAVGVNDVRAWHASQILTGHSVLAVAGDVEPAEAARLVAAAFDDLKSAKRRPVAAPGWVDHVTQRVEYRDKAQSALVLAFPAPARTDADRFASVLLATIASGLGGRFFDELRDKQSLAYTVHASHVSRLMGGMFVSYIAMSPEKEEAARQGLLREFDRLRQIAVTDEEIERAKTYATGTRAIAQQSGAVVLSEIIDAWAYGSGLGELDEWDARIRAVTADDIQRLANTYFDETRRVEGIIRGTGRLVTGR